MKYRKTNINFFFICGLKRPHFIKKIKLFSIYYIKAVLKTAYQHIQETFGRNLRRIREENHFSLRDLASNCNLDDSKISKIENGRLNIQLSTIFELAKGLGVEPKELLNFNTLN